MMLSMPTRSLTLLPTLLVVAVLGPFAARSAAAGPQVGVEIDLAIPVGDTADTVDLGWSVGGRAGFGLPIPAVDLVLEAIFDYASFPITDTDLSADAIRIAAGARIGVPIPYVPALFAHVGYGDVSLDLGPIDASDDGLTWDVGLSSDLLSLPILDLGLHLAYKSVVLEEDDFTWIGLGLHAIFGF